MAGAGYKLFNTGDVLTAAQVNTYLQEQAVMRFANAAARTTALSGVLAEGMVSYLDDTNAVQVYNGSAWVNVGEAGDITAVTAGTGLTGGGTSGAVTLDFDVANFGGGTFAAGKNKIINGDFRIWQRGTSFTLTGGEAYNYTADRFNAQFNGTGATCTVSQQTFTPGSAPVAGYEGQFFLRWNRSAAGTSNTLNYLKQNIEDVRTFAGQTITLSFWAKADAARTLTAQIYQEFGSGGSGAVLALNGSVSLTTNWQRFTITAAVPSISGKTIGTNNSLTLYFIQPVGVAFTIDYWGVQVEAGNVATAFQTATGTLAGELAACQRYYNRFTLDGPFDFINSYGYTANTTTAFILIPFPVQMRAGTPILDFAGNLLVKDMTGGSFPITTPFFTANGTSGKNGNINAISSGMTGGRYAQIQGNNDATAYIGFSREL